MRKLMPALVALAAACAPANDDADETTSADSAAISAPAPVAGAASDTLAKSNASATTSDSLPASTAAFAQPRPRAASPVAQQESVRGTVRLTGTAMEPITSIETPQGTFIVRGALERDVRSLAGAVVVLRGKVTAPPHRFIDVEAYSIAEIEGQPATVGMVTGDARAIVIGTDTVALRPPPAGLQPGARIWVTGPRTGNTLRVASFGVIRPPQ